MVLGGQILIFVGAIFLFLGALGILRMPDIYNRLQAGTKATTLGAMLVFLGAGVYDLNLLPKAILLIIFTAMGNPIVSSLIARSAHNNKVKAVKKTQFDKYEEDFSTQNKTENK